jgi:hypothetical protein
MIERLKRRMAARFFKRADTQALKCRRFAMTTG